jgi:micrococcal nuclease
MYDYWARATRVIDGDTLDCEIDVGFYLRTTQRLRLLAASGPVDAYEMHDKDINKRVLALLGRNRVAQLLPPSTQFSLHTEKTNEFGRFLGRITLMDGRDLGDLLLAEGLAVPFTG